jgi:hypothetical protein
LRAVDKDKIQCRSSTASSHSTSINSAASAAEPDFD